VALIAGIGIRVDLPAKTRLRHPDEEIVGKLMRRAVETGRISASWQDLGGVSWTGVDWSRPTLQFSPWTLAMQGMARAIDPPRSRDPVSAAVKRARTASIGFGLVAVALTALAGWRISRSLAVGLLAGTLLLLAPLHTLDSLYARPEAFLSMLVAATFLFSVDRGGEPAGRLGLMLSAGCAGLAIATKINAAPLALWPALLAWFGSATTSETVSSRRSAASGWARLVLVAGAAAMGFVLGVPEILTRPDLFRDGLILEYRHYSEEGHKPHESSGPWDWNVHWMADYLFRLGLGPAPTVAAAAFLIVAWRFPNPIARRLALWLIIAMTLGVIPKVRFERNMEIFLASLVIGASWCLEWLARTLLGAETANATRPTALGETNVDERSAATESQHPIDWPRTAIVLGLCLAAFGPSLVTSGRLYLELSGKMIDEDDAVAALRDRQAPYTPASDLPEVYPEGAPGLLVYDFGDPFSRARIERGLPIPPGGKAVILESNWGGYGYPFSTIDVYHGPRRIILIRPAQEPPGMTPISGQQE
jgi:hypothetical protein